MQFVPVAGYRDIIDHAFQVQRDYYACAGENEKRFWLDRMERAVAELKSVDCKRANETDRTQYANAIRTSDFMIREMQKRFQSFDALHQKLAFAGEWK
jgi:hypothetical protein